MKTYYDDAIYYATVPDWNHTAKCLALQATIELKRDIHRPLAILPNSAKRMEDHFAKLKKSVFY